MKKLFILLLLLIYSYSYSQSKNLISGDSIYTSGNLSQFGSDILILSNNRATGNDTIKVLSYNNSEWVDISLTDMTNGTVISKSSNLVIPAGLTYTYGLNELYINKLKVVRLNTLNTTITTVTIKPIVNPVIFTVPMFVTATIDLPSPYDWSSQRYDSLILVIDSLTSITSQLITQIDLISTNKYFDNYQSITDTNCGVVDTLDMTSFSQWYRLNIIAVDSTLELSYDIAFPSNKTITIYEGGYSTGKLDYLSYSVWYIRKKLASGIANYSVVAEGK